MGIVIGSCITKPKRTEIETYESLHVLPEEEKDEREMKKTHRLFWIYIIFGLLLGLFFINGYALPYMRAVGGT